MAIKIFKDYDSLSLEAANEIIHVVKTNPRAVLCLASGETPRKTYQLLAQKAIRENIDLSQCTFVGLDEWIGIPPDNEGSCAFFLNKYLFHPLEISPQQIHLFDALTEDLYGECQKTDAQIARNGGIDLMVVGVGMNGHVGFNEPGVPEGLYSHVVALDPVTKNVGQKYFTKATELSYGITLGLRHFLESQRAIMLASGKKKAEVIRQAIEGEVSIDLPASVIRKHSDWIIMLDEDAASELQPGDANP